MSDRDVRQCPDCEKLIPLSHWIYTEISCEDCGSHPGVMCPICWGVFDLIFYEFIRSNEVG